MSIPRFNIEVLNLSHGWENIRLIIDDDIIEFNASYIGQEPVSSFIEAAVGLEEDSVNREYFARWRDEPGKCNIDYYLDNGTLNLSMEIEAPDSRGEMISTIRKYSIPFDLFHSAVRELAIRVVKKYGIVGFNSNWSSTDDPQEVFPVGSFLRLLGMEATFKEASDELTSSFQDEVKLLSVVLGKKSI